MSSARFNANPVQPASAHGPFITVEGPVRIEQASTPSWAASVLLDYAHSPLTLQVESPIEGERRVPLIEDALVLHTNAAVHLTPSIAVDASLPILAFQLGEGTDIYDRRFKTPPGYGIGDVRLGALFRTWFGTGVGGVVGVRGWAPTGTEDAFISDDRLRAEIVAGMFGQTESVRFGCTANGSPTFPAGKPGDRIVVGCATDAQRVPGGPRVGIEVFGGGIAIDPDIRTRSIVEAWGTLRQDAGSVRLTIAAGRGFGTSPGNAAVRLLGMVSFRSDSDDTRHGAKTNSTPDRDLDGILNEQDACPDEAGLQSDEPKRHGCPDLDSDGDGIADDFDACPKQKGARASDRSISGCPDRDNDRIVDKLDACPEEPAPPSDNPDRIGCPQHARVVGDQFLLTPAIDPNNSDPSAESAVLAEVAFALRATPEIQKASVEVRLIVGPDDDEIEVADRAVERAEQLVAALVQLGVERNRIEPVGAISPNTSLVRIVIVDRKGPPPGAASP